MENMEFICEKLEQLLGIGIVCAELVSEGTVGYQEYNPVYRNRELMRILTEGADGQERPFIYQDEYQVCFACIRCQDRHYLAGPMCTAVLDRMESHRFYRTYGIEEPNERRLRFFTVSKVLSVVELLAKVLLDLEYEDEELLYVNHIVEEKREETQKEQVLFEFRGRKLKAYHHTYQEERKLLEFIRNGQVEEAVWYAKNLDNNLGLLSSKPLNHWKNVTVAAITLATRAAIEGGLMPSTAYKLSDFYIQKSDACTEVAQVIDNRNRAIEEFAEQVRQSKMPERNSRYTELCMEYVEQHYREKIKLEEIASRLGISSGYLSKVFHKDTGIRFQDYVVQVRIEHAANLLLYSEESIARIAEYVNFPSQSYFGKVFRQYKGMSPGKFREAEKPQGF